MVEEKQVLRPRGNPKYTWDDTIAAIGQDFSEGRELVAQEAIAYNDVVRYCEPWEIGNLLYWDEKVAKQVGYRGVVVPWSAIKQTFSYGGFWRPGEPTRFLVQDNLNAAANTGVFSPEAREIPMPLSAQGFYTDMKIEFFEPVVVGDQLTRRGNKLVNVRPRKTAVGDGAFTNRESEWYNQRGELVARGVEGAYAFNPIPQKDREPRPVRKESTAPPPPTTVRTKSPEAFKTQQLYYEDVRVGDEPPPVTFNMTIQRMVMSAGANRDFAIIHHNTAAGRSSGAPNMYLNNVSTLAMWERVISDWIGIRGRVKTVEFRITTFHAAGDVVTVKGQVKKKWQENGQNLINLDMNSEHSRGSCMVGSVVIALPSRPS
ncbi:MAG: MaoC family dehydratase N-terminal domain-containing protein [Dehalococcoidia bacterium]|nr:MaoC family dehydratase N-terminal domain-containing protein [Dehalococcoidia bacterium]